MKLILALVGAVPSLILGYVLFSVWVNPMAWDDGHWVPYGIGLLLVEFLILHSSVMINHLAATQENLVGKLKLFAGLLLFYGLMGFGFAKTTNSPTLLFLLIAIMLARFVSALGADLRKDQAFNKRAAFGVTMYLLVAAISVFIDFPELGITDTVLREVYPERGSGLWERHPEQAIVAAALYFSLTGIAELYWGLTAKPKSTVEDA